MKRHKIHHSADIVGRCKKGIIPFLLCFVFMGYGQNISVNFPNITVERALEILRNQEGYSFSVKTNDVNLRQKVNADLQNQPIEKVLETIFQNQPVSFEIEGKMVRIIKAPEKDSKQTGSTAESKKISGRVTDKQGEPLIGVSIIAKGANKGTITNILFFNCTRQIGYTILLCRLRYPRTKIRKREYIERHPTRKDK